LIAAALLSPKLIRARSFAHSLHPAISAARHLVCARCVYLVAGEAAEAVKCTTPTTTTTTVGCRHEGRLVERVPRSDGVAGARWCVPLSRSILRRHGPSSWAVTHKAGSLSRASCIVRIAVRSCEHSATQLRVPGARFVHLEGAPRQPHLRWRNAVQASVRGAYRAVPSHGLARASCVGTDRLLSLRAM